MPGNDQLALATFDTWRLLYGSKLNLDRTSSLIIAPSDAMEELLDRIGLWEISDGVEPMPFGLGRGL
jgi:hypothetical protein